jgi:integrase
MFQTQEPKKTAATAPPRREGMSLYNSNGRKYLNTAERRRFLGALDRRPPAIRLFCLTLMWTGCRISEALALAPRCFDLEAGTVEIETLKRRKLGVVRQVPLPPDLLGGLCAWSGLAAMQRDPYQAYRRLWCWSRSTAWRHVKNIMGEAQISGNSAMPKGLRHTFGVAAFHSVPPHLVQRWLGHASLRTTAIYGDVSGPEERSFAERLWGAW